MWCTFVPNPFLSSLLSCTPGDSRSGGEVRGHKYPSLFSLVCLLYFRPSQLHPRPHLPSLPSAGKITATVPVHQDAGVEYSSPCLQRASSPPGMVQGLLRASVVGPVSEEAASLQRWATRLYGGRRVRSGGAALGNPTRAKFVQGH